MTIHILAGIEHQPLCAAPTPTDRQAHPHVADGRLASSRVATCDDCKAMNGGQPSHSVLRRVSRRKGNPSLRSATLERIAKGIQHHLGA